MKIPTLDFVNTYKDLVRMKETVYDGVYLLKYTNKVFYRYLWGIDDSLIECRGTLVDKDFNIVSRPLTKIFNYDEKFAPEFDDNEICIVDDKINGFMTAVTWHKDQLIVSTTGTTDSPYAIVAREEVLKVVNPKLFMDYPDYTFIFEICTKEDKHIIAEDYGVYLLQARLKQWDVSNLGLTSFKLNEMRLMKRYRNPDNFNESFKRPKRWMFKFGDIKNILKDYKREGFVVTSVNDMTKQVKMKSPYYLTSKFLAKLNNKNIEMFLNNPQRAKEKLDEEFFPIVEYLNQNLEYFKTLEYFERAMYVQEFFDEG